MPLRRTISVARPIPPAPQLVERFAADPGRWLPPPARERGMNRWELDLRLGDAHRAVIAELGEVWRTERGLWRAISWAPWEQNGELVPGPVWLPAFEGSIGLREPGGDHAALVLQGGYVPPFGTLGLLADTLVAKRLARESLAALLEEVAIGLRAVEAWPPGTQKPRADSLALRSAR